MKTNINQNDFSPSPLLLVSLSLMLLLFIACDKDNDNNNNGQIWDPAWMIGTWEGTTPASVSPFAGTKIRIVFENYNLEQHDTTPAGSNMVYAYSGTFTWDVDDSAWSMRFSHANFPIPDYNVIIYDGMNTIGGQSMNNVSLRITDTLQTNPWHSIDLDWGPYVDNSGNAPTSIDFFGDVEIDISGTLYRADYPPNDGSMIRLTKK